MKPIQNQTDRYKFEEKGNARTRQDKTPEQIWKNDQQSDGY